MSAGRNTVQPTFNSSTSVGHLFRKSENGAVYRGTGDGEVYDVDVVEPRNVLGLAGLGLARADVGGKAGVAVIEHVDIEGAPDVLHHDIGIADIVDFTSATPIGLNAQAIISTVTFVAGLVMSQTYRPVRSRKFPTQLVMRHRREIPARPQIDGQSAAPPRVLDIGAVRGRSLISSSVPMSRTAEFATPSRKLANAFPVLEVKLEVCGDAKTTDGLVLSTSLKCV